MPRKGENIHKRKDGRWEARYVKGYDEDGKAVYGYVFGKSYLETKRKRQETQETAVLPALPLYSLLSLSVATAVPTAGSPLSPITQIVQIGGNISNCYKVNHYETASNNILVMNEISAADHTTGSASVDTVRSPLLADIALQWLESLVSIRKKSTVVKYAGQLKNYIIPTFGDKHIDSITTTDLMKFCRWLLNAGRKDGKNGGHLSPRTVINILAEMKSIKKFAIIHGFEVRYATECVEIPKQPSLLRSPLLTEHSAAGHHGSQEVEQEGTGQSQKKVLTVEEQKRLMSYLKETINDSMKTDQKGWLSSFGIMLSLSTGIRLGELCALKWSDFSLADGEFRIQRTMQRLPVNQLPIQSGTSGITSGLLVSNSNNNNKTVGNIAVESAVADNTATVAKECGSDGKHGKHKNKKTAVEIGAPKSQCSIRTIPIPEVIMPYIRSAYDAAHSFNGGLKDGEAGSECGSDAFFLTGKTGCFVEPRTMENRFKAVLKKCALRTINFHALRHSFATRAVELGFDVKTLSEILGHANVGITLDRYVHPSMKVKKENMDKMGEMWK